MKNMLFACLLVAVSLLTTTPCRADFEQVVAGAGPSTKVAELFFAGFDKDPASKDYRFIVMPSSIKHHGGILSSGKYLFGRTGRPLSSDEKALGKDEILLGQVPISIVSGLETGVKQLNLNQLQQIFTGEITNWNQLGGADAQILLVGREAGEALFQVLQAKLSFFKKVKFDQVFNKDHEVVKFLNSPAGGYAISFGAKPNFKDYNLLTITRFSAGVPVGLVYDLENRNNKIVKAAIKYAGTPAWKNQLKTLNMLPVD